MLPRIILIFNLLLAGCSADEVRTPSGSVGISWSKELSPGLKDWIAEGENELGRPVMVFQVHGGYRDGVWTACGDPEHPEMPMEGIAQLLRAARPDLPLIIPSCNQHGVRIDEADVYFPLDITWSSPIGWHSYGVWKLKDYARGGRRG